MPASKAPALSSLLIGGEKVAMFSSHVLPHSFRISNSLVPTCGAVWTQTREYFNPPSLCPKVLNPESNTRYPSEFYHLLICVRSPSLAPVCVHVCESEYLRWKKKKKFREYLWTRQENLLYSSLSKDIFERRTSTGSGLFSFLGRGFAQIFGQIVSMSVKTRSNTNSVVSRNIKRDKT